MILFLAHPMSSIHFHIYMCINTNKNTLQKCITLYWYMPAQLRYQSYTHSHLCPTCHCSDVDAMWFNVMKTRNKNEELCFWVIFYQIKSPETCHVYSQKVISFITLISGKIMFTWWPVYFSSYKIQKCAVLWNVRFFVVDQRLWISWDTLASDYAS